MVELAVAVTIFMVGFAVGWKTCDIFHKHLK